MSEPFLVVGRSDPRRVGCKGGLRSVWSRYPGSRAWTRAKAAADGCAESMATLTLRIETVTRAPILRSLRRSVPAVARARRVPCSARRRAWKRIEAKAEKRSRSWLAAKRDAEGPVGEEIQLLLFDERGRVRSGLAAPGDQSGRSPSRMRTVRGGHVRRVGRVSALPVDPDVRGDPAVPVEDLHGLGRDPNVDLATAQRVGTL